jgi:hypothetical protein
MRTIRTVCPPPLLAATSAPNAGAIHQTALSVAGHRLPHREAHDSVAAAPRARDHRARFGLGLGKVEHVSAISGGGVVSASQGLHPRRLVDIAVAEERATFSFALNRAKPSSSYPVLLTADDYHGAHAPALAVASLDAVNLPAFAPVANTENLGGRDGSREYPASLNLLVNYMAAFSGCHDGYSGMPMVDPTTLTTQHALALPNHHA